MLPSRGVRRVRRIGATPLKLVASLLLVHCASGPAAPPPATSPGAAHPPVAPSPAARGVFLVNEGDVFTQVVAAARDGGLVVGMVYQDTPKVLDPKAPSGRANPQLVDHQLAIAKTNNDGTIRWIRRLTFSPAQLMTPEHQRDSNQFLDSVVDDGPNGVWAMALVGDRSALVHLGPNGEQLGILFAQGRYSQMHQLAFDGDALYVTGHFSGAFRLGDGPALTASGTTKDGDPRFHAFVARVRRADLHVEWVRTIDADRVERVLRAEVTSDHGVSILVNDHAPGDVVRVPGQAPVRVGDGTWSRTYSAAFQVTFDATGNAAPLRLFPPLPAGTSRSGVARDANGVDVWLTLHCEPAQPAQPCTLADEWVDADGQLLVSRVPGITSGETMSSIKAEANGLLLLQDYDTERRPRIRSIHALRGLPQPGAFGGAVPFAGGWAIAVQLSEGWMGNSHQESGLMIVPSHWDGVLELQRTPWTAPSP